MTKLLPKARVSGVVTEQVAGELLVYNLEHDKAYCLNDTAALVWKYCDGKTSPAEIAKRLKKEIGAAIDENVVWYALDQLGRDGLLREQLPLPATLAQLTRRQHLRALGKVAAIAVPMVTAIVAPTPLAAASACGTPTGRPNGCSCNTTIPNQCDKVCCGTGTPHANTCQQNGPACNS